MDANDLRQCYGPEVPGIHADVDLSGHGPEAAVAVAMQVPPAAVHVAPGPERIVAQDEVRAGQFDFGIGLYARPASQARRGCRIVVPGHQMLVAVQLVEKLRKSRNGQADREVAEMPDIVISSDHIVPAFHHRGVHLGDGGEWPAVEGTRTGMAEVGVAGEEDRGYRHSAQVISPRRSRAGSIRYPQR